MRARLGARDIRLAGGFPLIITICGSSRFIAEMAVIAWEMEKQGYVTMGPHLLPQHYPDVQPDHQAEHEGVAETLDAVHLRKIDLADEIFVLNKDHYIGDRTRAEIEYARKQGKVVRFLEDIPF